MEEINFEVRDRTGNTLIDAGSILVSAGDTIHGVATELAERALADIKEEEVVHRIFLLLDVEEHSSGVSTCRYLLPSSEHHKEIMGQVLPSDTFLVEVVRFRSDFVALQAQL